MKTCFKFFLDHVHLGGCAKNWKHGKVRQVFGHCLYHGSSTATGLTAPRICQSKFDAFLIAGLCCEECLGDSHLVSRWSIWRCLGGSLLCGGWWTEDKLTQQQHSTPGCNTWRFSKLHNLKFRCWTDSFSFYFAGTNAEFRHASDPHFGTRLRFYS